MRKYAPLIDWFLGDKDKPFYVPLNADVFRVTTPVNETRVTTLAGALNSHSFYRDLLMDVDSEIMGDSSQYNTAIGFINKSFVNSNELNNFNYALFHPNNTTRYEAFEQGIKVFTSPILYAQSLTRRLKRITGSMEYYDYLGNLIYTSLNNFGFSQYAGYMQNHPFTWNNLMIHIP